jgi:FkbM family methyltransferase
MLYNLLSFFNKTFEVEISKIINKSQRKNINIVDVGCYLGNFSRNLKHKIDKKCNFFLIDANPNIKLHDFDHFSIGLSNKTGNSFFYLNDFFSSSGSGFDSIVRKDKWWVISRKLLSLNVFSKFSKHKINTETLDNFCKKNKIYNIEVLKIDCEGHEDKILFGAKKMLKKTNIIQIEILENKQLFKNKFDSIKKLLEKNNFKLKILKKIRIVSLFSNICSVDALYIKKII